MSFPTYLILLFVVILICSLYGRVRVREGLDSTQTMKCPSQFPHLLKYTPQNKYFCYELPDGSKQFGKTIMNNPEEYFTDEIMTQLEECAGIEFKYG